MTRTLRYKLRTVTDSLVEGAPAIYGPQHAAKLFRPLFAGVDVERFYVATLNAKNRVRGVYIVSEGTTNASLLGVKEIMYEAVADRADAIIVCHNHPSGDPAPSETDVQASRQLAAACEVLGIKLLDHVVLGSRGRHVSMTEMGLLPNCKVVDGKHSFTKKGGE
jgi:DNA repair protein RadC